MIMSYKEAIEQYGNDYQLNKAVKSKELYKIENGIYLSDNHFRIVQLPLYNSLSFQ